MQRWFGETRTSLRCHIDHELGGAAAFWSMCALEPQIGSTDGLKTNQTGLRSTGAPRKSPDSPRNGYAGPRFTLTGPRSF
jgi:hypothetical protein